MYINDKPTGALMGQVAFGGVRASGTTRPDLSSRCSAGSAGGLFARTTHSILIGAIDTWPPDYRSRSGEKTKPKCQNNRVRVAQVDPGHDVVEQYLAGEIPTGLAAETNWLQCCHPVERRCLPVGKHRRPKVVQDHILRSIRV